MAFVSAFFTHPDGRASGEINPKPICIKEHPGATKFVIRKTYIHKKYLVKINLKLLYLQPFKNSKNVGSIFYRRIKVGKNVHYTFFYKNHFHKNHVYKNVEAQDS